MSDIQIDYTSRDYAALKADLISLVSTRTGTAWDPTDPSDLGSVLVESFAYMGDIMSYYLDRIANETSVDTATKRETLLNFAALYGYKPSGPTPAELRVSFTNQLEEGTIDIPIGTQVMAVLSYGNYSEVYFETTEAATAVLPGQTVSLYCREGKTVNTDRPDLIDPATNRPLPVNLGNSDGTASQEIQIIDNGIVDDSLKVYVGQGVAFSTWEYAPSLIEYDSQALKFTTRQNEDGSITLIFGDGINGAIPPSGQLISASYKTSVGAAGNIGAATINEITFIPGNIDPEAITYLSATNSKAAVGGADADNTTQLKEKIKAAINTRKRAVTLKDYEELASMVPSIGKVKADAAVYSMVNLYVQSPNDQTATPGIVTENATVTNASGDGTYITYTTDGAHGLGVGQIVSVTGITPSSLDVTDVTVYDTPTTSTFRVASTVTDSYTSGGITATNVTTTSWDNLSSSVSSYMADKIPVGTTLLVHPPVYVPIYITVEAIAMDAYKASKIKLDVYKAFLGSNGLCIFDKNVFGRTLYLSSVIATAANIEGVEAANITQLSTDGSITAATISLDANEIPYLVPENLLITVTGGIQ